MTDAEEGGESRGRRRMAQVIMGRNLSAPGGSNTREVRQPFPLRMCFEGGEGEEAGATVTDA